MRHTTRKLQLTTRAPLDYTNKRMSGLTSKHLESFGQKHCENFLGVFSCDIHPEINGKKVFSVIFNESTHDEDGSHFVCIYAREKTLYYFDSLGLKCENKYILQFINLCNRKIVETNIQIQSYDSIFCGYFCLSFILFMCLNISYNKYFNFFSKTNLTLNDKIVVHLIIKLLD